MTPSSELPQPFTPKNDVIEPQVPEKCHQEVPQDVDSSHGLPATAAGAEAGSTSPNKAMVDPSKWISWFSKSSTTLTHTSPLSEGTLAKIEPSPNDMSEQHGTTNPFKPGPVDDSKPGPGSKESPSSLSSGPVIPTAAQTESRYWPWIGLWKDAATQPKNHATIADSEPTKEAGDSLTPQDLTNTTEDIHNSSPPDNSTGLQLSALPKYTGWAFWSKDRLQHERSGQIGNAGKLVLAESPSQSCPDLEMIVDAPKSMPKSRKQEKPQSIDVTNKSESTELVKAQPLKGKTSSMATMDSSIKSMEKSDVRTKREPTNLLLPAFKSTYKAIGKPSFIQQISRLLKYTRPPDAKHVTLLQEPARIRNALAIVRYWGVYKPSCIVSYLQ